MHKGEASVPFSTDDVQQSPRNKYTDAPELHFVLSRDTDTSYGTEFLAELDSLEGRQMHGSSAPKSTTFECPSDSPCDSEFLRKIDEFEHAHISHLPTPLPAGKVQVETLDRGLLSGNKLQRLGTDPRQIQLEPVELYDLHTPKNAARDRDQGIDVARLHFTIQHSYLNICYLVYCFQKASN